MGKISLQDIQSAPIEKHFDSATIFIHDALLNKNNRVLVHCQMGISRSTTITIAYLIKAKKYTLHDAYKLCQQSRPRIRPNDGFYQRLVEFESTVHGKSTQSQVDKEK